MADNTINYGLPYPEGGDSVVVHSDVEKLAKSTDAAMQRVGQTAESALPFRGYLDEFSGTWATLEGGRYEVRYIGTAEAWGIPQKLLGMVDVIPGGLQRTIRFYPNDAGSGTGVKSWWENATDSNGDLRDRWQRGDKAIMTTAPVVLTAPAGEYSQADSRGAVRLPFTVPTDVAKVRVHMRPWNYRTGKTWGPATLRGLMIAPQEDGGTITSNRWYAPNVDGQTVTGSGDWVSDWFYVGLSEGSTYLLSYAVEWQDTTRDLVLGTCWSSFDLDKWDSTEDAIFQNGWGGFFLQPMDIWIECEAPSTVPVWGYFGASNTVGMDSGDPVFGAYPTLHARKNKAFCALTAAGGWSIMDDTAHDTALMRRFGYPTRLLDRAYLDWGSNIAVRGATATEAIDKLEYWMNVQLGAFGDPEVFMATQIAAPDIEDTSDLAGTLSFWNEWIRYESTKRSDVRGVIDFAAVFADPENPWTARPELRAGATNVHFNAAGQKLRAQACDGEIQLPVSAAKNPAERVLVAADIEELRYKSGSRLIPLAPDQGWTDGRVTLSRTGSPAAANRTW